MARDPAQIRADLNALGPDPLGQWQAEKDALVEELADAEAEHAQRRAAYRELRASVQERLGTAEAMSEAIRKALGPVVLMMQQHRDLIDALDDDCDRLIAEASALQLGEGPLPRPRVDWPRYVVAELRRGRP